MYQDYVLHVMRILNTNKNAWSILINFKLFSFVKLVFEMTSWKFLSQIKAHGAFYTLQKKKKILKCIMRNYFQYLTLKSIVIHFMLLISHNYFNLLFLFYQLNNAKNCSLFSNFAHFFNPLLFFSSDYQHNQQVH